MLKQVKPVSVPEYNVFVSDKILAALAIGFAVGVFLESFARFGFALAGFFVLLAVAMFFVLRIVSECQEFGFGGGGVLLPLFLIGAALGAGRMALSEPRVFPLDNFLEQKITIEGIISEEPDVREISQLLKVETSDISLSSVSQKVSAKILVKTNPYLMFAYGDKIKATGFLKKPQSFQTNSGGDFDYPSYLAKDGIFYTLEQANVSKLSSGDGSWLKTNLFKLKHKFIGTVGKVVPEPEASLLGGLVIGGKRSLGKDWLSCFQKAGVMHIVVLSGYNITIVAESVIKFFSLALPQLLSMIFGALAIILFAIMTGGSATVVRATIMALLVILAKSTSRQYGVTRALIIAGVLMVIQNPAIVAFDPSFQLSFMATIALIYLSPLIKPHLTFLPEKWNIREVAVSTISTQLFVLPLLLYMTGQFSIVGLAVNLLILGFIPMTMFFGFLAGVVGFISLILALPLAYIAYGFLYYELAVVKIFSSLPFAAISLPTLPGIAVVGIYLAVAAWLVWWHGKARIKNYE